MRLITMSAYIEAASTPRLERFAARIAVPFDADLDARLFLRVTVSAMVQAELEFRRLSPFSAN